MASRDLRGHRKVDLRASRGDNPREVIRIPAPTRAAAAAGPSLRVLIEDSKDGKDSKIEPLFYIPLHYPLSLIKSEKMLSLLSFVSFPRFHLDLRTGSGAAPPPPRPPSGHGGIPAPPPAEELTRGEVRG